MKKEKPNKELIKKVFNYLNISIEDKSIKMDDSYIIAKEAITKKQIVLLYFKDKNDFYLINELFLTVANFNAEIVIVITDKITKNVMRIINWLNSISNEDTEFILETGIIQSKQPQTIQDEFILNN